LDDKEVLLRFNADVKPSILLSCVLCLVVPGCSLITVPIKTAGSIVTTTVSTTGKVITAPFDAVGRSKATKDDKQTAEKTVEESRAAKTVPMVQ
jgi:hypothetical protein